LSLTFGLVLDFATPVRSLAEQLERYRPVLAAAEKYGFSSLTMGEGHSSRPEWGHTPSPFLVLAALAPLTSLRVGTGVTLLQGWSALRLAYDGAVLDQLTGGRLILGVGLGSRGLGRHFGLETGPAGRYADEVLAAVRALWAGEDGFEGKRVSVAHGIGLRPIQPGGPPIWVGGSVPQSVERAARWGNGYIGSTSQPFDQLAALAEAYRAALARSGQAPSAGVVATNRLTLVADTEERARELAERHVGEVLRFYARRGTPVPADPKAALAETAALFAEQDESRCLVGTPEEVIRRARRYEEAGITHILARVAPHDLPPDDVVHTVELLGRSVLPAFR